MQLGRSGRAGEPIAPLHPNSRLAMITDTASLVAEAQRRDSRFINELLTCASHNLCRLGAQFSLGVIYTSLPLRTRISCPHRAILFV